MNWKQKVKLFQNMLGVIESTGQFTHKTVEAMRQTIENIDDETDSEVVSQIQQNLSEAIDHLNDLYESAIEQRLQDDEEGVEDFDEEDLDTDEDDEDEEEEDDEEEGDEEELGQSMSFSPSSRGVSKAERILQQNAVRAQKLTDMQEKLVVREMTDRLLQGMAPASPERAAASKFIGSASTVDELQDKLSTFEGLMQDLNGDKWANGNWGSGVNIHVGYASDAPVTTMEGEGRPPENVNEMVDALVQDACNHYELDQLFAGLDASGKVMLQDSRNVRRAASATRCHPSDGLRMILQNIINTPEGNAAAQMYVLHLQGRLHQALPSGGMGSGSFAAAMPFVFPMVSQVFPQLFVTRIGATIAIDRPLAKLFTRTVTGRHHTTGTTNELHDMYYHDSDLADSPGEGSTSSRVRIGVTSVDVSVEDRTLSAIWDIPTEQDYRAYYNRDIMTEVVAEAANEIAREINTTALGMCVTASDDRQIDWGKLTPDSTTYPGWTAREWQKTLLTAILRANTEIFKKRYRMGSILLCDPDTVVRLQQTMEMGAFQTARDTWNFSNGIALAGSINNMYTVFSVGFWGHTGAAESTVAYDDLALVIARGETFSDQGLIYCPYTYEVMPQLTQPGQRTREIGILTRDALKVVIDEMFARVNITNETGTPW